MANITAKDVAALRAKTGIGMMECKKALVEADGDIDAAVKILREKGELKHTPQPLDQGDCQYYAPEHWKHQRGTLASAPEVWPNG